jgi:hypothetical protein
MVVVTTTRPATCTVNLSGGSSFKFNLV